MIKRVNRTYGGTDMTVLDMHMWLIMCVSCACEFKHACVCVCVCLLCVLQFKNVFPYAFCVCSGDERVLCSHVC